MVVRADLVFDYHDYQLLTVSITPLISSDMLDAPKVLWYRRDRLRIHTSSEASLITWFCPR